MKLIKTIHITFLSTLVFSAMLKEGNAQFVNNGTSITITNGAVLYTGYSFVNAANGSVMNEGSIITDTSVINEPGATLSGNGIYTVQADFINSGTFNQDSSMLEFTGAFTSSLKNTSGKIYAIQVAKSANKFVNLLDDQTVLDNIMFLNDKNWIRLGDNTLTLGAKCFVEDYNNQRYFITNGTGMLKKLKVKGTPFTFPVGFDKSTYNEITITENGTSDDYSVRCLENALLNGSSGNPISAKGIKASWVVEQKTPGGADAVIQAQWKNTDELTGFDYTHCMVVRYTPSGWGFINNQAGMATGGVYRTIGRSGLSSFGYFTVLSNANPTFDGIAGALSEENAFIAAKVNTQFKVYPTIVQNDINIDVPAVNKNNRKMNISILDGAGKTAWQKQNADYSSQKIFLPDLTAGIYTVLIEADDNRFVQKIIIAR